MVSNEVQWSATSSNNRAHKIVLSTKRDWLSVAKVVHNFFYEKSAEFAIILELNGYSGCMEIG